MTLKKGDGLKKLSARKLNEAFAALDRGPPPAIPLADSNSSARDGIIRVRNTTGLSIDVGGVVGLANPTILPSENPAEFAAALMFDAVVPTGGEDSESSSEPTEDYHGRFAILLEPLNAGDVCTAAALVCGITAAKIYVAREGQVFADIYPGETMALKSADAGSAQIIWVEPGTGEKFGMVRVGNLATGVRCARLTEAMTDDVPSAEAKVWVFDPTAGDVSEETDEPVGAWVETEEIVHLRSFLRPDGTDVAERTRCYFVRMGNIDVAIVFNCDADPEDEEE